MRNVILLAAVIFLAGCKPSPSLKFLSNQTTVYQEGFTNGYSQLFNDGVLRNLPNTCVDGLQESFQARDFGRTQYSEAVLFARDPASVEGELAQLSDAAKLTDAWDRVAAVPQPLPNPLSLPVALTVEGQGSDPSPATAFPTAAAFWGTAPPVLNSLQYRSCAPLGTIRQTSGATINTYVVYHHGACDNEQDLTGIIKMVVDGLWDQFSSSGELSDKQSHYRHAISVIELGSLTDGKNGNTVPLSDVRGGFLLTFHFRGNILGTNNEVWGTYKYLFSLSDGILQIAQPDVTRCSLDSSGPWGWKLKDKLQKGMEKSLPQTLQQTFSTNQEVTLPLPAGTNCTVIGDCIISSGFLANAITLKSLQAVGVPSPTASQLSRLRCAVGSAIDCQNLGRAAPDFSKLWDCTQGPKGTSAQPCKFRLPAKRLLMLPDSLDLVWFDDFEFDNPVFGVFVAGGQSASQKLCTAAPPTVGPTGYYVRQFAKAGQFH